MKKLKFSSIDLQKFTELVVDKQPTELEIKTIVQSYIDTLHLSHVAISIPLDQNANFLAHGHVPAPLTIDEFTRIWIDTIHNAGVNVYFRGTFSGIKNLYDFGFDKSTPIGTADTAITDGNKTWMGRIYQWLNTNLGYIRPGDMIGIIPDTTFNLFNGNFFLSGQNLQSEFLAFNIELKKLCSVMTRPIKDVHIGFSGNVYRDIVSEWIPDIYDLTNIITFDYVDAGVISVDYYGGENTPVGIEKALNDLYTRFRMPIFLSEWSLPLGSVSTEDNDKKAGEFFEAFARLRDKGILIGLNYFDGLDFSSGVLTDGKINAEGKVVNAFFLQGVELRPKQEIIKVEEKLIPDEGVEAFNNGLKRGLEPEQKKVKRQRRKKKKLEERSEPSIKPNIKRRRINVSFLIKMAIYMALGAIATNITILITGINFGVLLIYVMIVYTLIIATILSREKV